MTAVDRIRPLPGWCSVVFIVAVVACATDSGDPTGLGGADVSATDTGGGREVADAAGTADTAGQDASTSDDADRDGICTCVTCGKRLAWQAMDAGHFLGGRRKGILFEPRCVHAQCKQCNAINPFEKYWVWMEARYGRQTIDELISQKWDRDENSWTRSELLAIIDDYTDRLREMNENLVP